MDSVSIAPTLLGKSRQQQSEHPYLYWDYMGNQAVRMRSFKALRKKDAKTIELYDLNENDHEESDFATQHDDIVRKIETIMREARTESEQFPLKRE